jgi:nicotinate-nucleotide adenylyltransferase
VTLRDARASRSLLRARAIRAPGPVKPGLRIGLLGGSFNPAHAGHVHASKVALSRLKLDYVWWLVSPHNPLKSKKELAPLERRVAFAKTVARDTRIRVSDIERTLGTRYTVDTLAALKKCFPKVHFVWLMGSDNLVQLPRWRRWKDIFALAPVAVVPRPGTALAARRCKAARRFAADRVAANQLALEAPSWTILNARGVPASATRLRAKPSWNR